jgi:uncharacterized membrane protein YdfJ with MMPL/SSD domain
MLTRLAELAVRRSRRVVLATLLFVVVAAAVGAPVLSKLTTGATDFQDPAAENVAARHELEQASGANPDVAVIAMVQMNGPVLSAAGRAKVAGVVRTLGREPAVAAVQTVFNTGNRDFVSHDGRETYAAVSFKPLSDKEQADAAKRLVKAFSADPAVLLGGPAVASSQIDTDVNGDLRRAELFAAPLLFLFSLLFFRGLIAALLPIFCAVVSIMGSFLALRIAHELTQISVFSINLITGLGIGLSIDYSLFIVSRYREELATAGPGPEAIRRTLRTAGRTVAFSALTVAAAMAALFAFPERFLYSMGIGGVFVSLIAATTAIVFLPAMLALLGTRVNAVAPARWQRAVAQTARAERTGPWYRLSQLVMRRALSVAILSAALLVVVGLPFFHVKFTGIDSSVLPTSASARQVQDILNSDFELSRTSPIYIAVTAPKSAADGVRRFAASLRALPGAAAVSRPQPVGPDAWRIDVTSKEGTLAGESQRLVDAVRRVEAPFRARVGGQTAAYVDQQDSILSRLPLGLAIAALTTLVLLFAMTGSVLLPIKAVLMNVLTLVSTLGALVFVFQDNHLAGLFRFTSQGALNSTQPILIGAVAFALSTDYAVFLLTRIKEARAHVENETEAVAVGMERTGRIVTAAALLLAIALGAFVTSRVIVIKELGFGVAFAVLVDAAIVRVLLVPSLMKLLGPWNWWAPAPLRRLHDRVGLHEGEELTPRPAAR